MLVQFSSVASNSFWPHWLQHARPPCPSPNPRACSNPCPSSQWCHPTISSPLVPSSCLQSFPASGSFLRSQFFASVGQSIGVLASASVLSMNIQDWFPLGFDPLGLISLQSKGLSRIFSNTTVQKHQFFSLTSAGAQYKLAPLLRTSRRQQRKNLQEYLQGEYLCMYFITFSGCHSTLIWRFILSTQSSTYDKILRIQLKPFLWGFPWLD